MKNNDENVIFEYKTKIIDSLSPFLKLILPFIIFIFISGCIFYGLKPTNMILYLISNKFILLEIIICIISMIILKIFLLPQIIFEKDKISYKFKYLKKLNKEIEYSDIKYFTIDKYLNILQIKSKNNFMNVFAKKTTIIKIAEILKSKISDLSKSEKMQSKQNKLNISLYIIFFLMALFMIPIVSFFFTKIADFHYNKFIKSSCKDETQLDEAYRLYSTASHNLSYHNYKQMLKIDAYKQREYLQDNIDYVNELFPNKQNETEEILKTKELIKTGN